MSKVAKTYEIEMQACEEALLHTDHVRAPANLEQMLTLEFVEINDVGEQSSRDAVIQWLLQKDAAARWEYSDFNVRQVSDTLRIVNYHAVQTLPQRSQGKGARHTSLWRYSPELDCWQLHYHQSTKVS